MPEVRDEVTYTWADPHGVRHVMYQATTNGPMRFVYLISAAPCHANHGIVEEDQVRADEAPSCFVCMVYTHYVE